MKNKYIALILALMQSFPVLSGGGMLLLGKTQGGSSVYIDLQSIVKRNKKSTAWIFSVMADPVVSKRGGKKMSDKGLVLFDCLERKISMSELYEYRNADATSLIGDPNKPHPDSNSRYMAPVPRSTMDIAMSVVCD